MGKAENLHLRAVNTLTRLGVAAGRLGIDALALTPRTTELVASIDRHVRVWLDADFQRMAVRTLAPAPVLSRPGTAYVEVESIPRSTEIIETALVIGSRPLEEDLRTLADAGVERSIVDDLGGRLQVLGVPASEVLGQTVRGPAHWLVGVEVGSNSVGEVSRVVDALGISAFQVAMLGQLHTELATAGCLVTLACTASSVDGLSVEYRDVAWERVIFLTDRLLSIKSARGYGVFAGAFNADNAGRVEITFRPDQKPRVRVGLEEKLE